MVAVIFLLGWVYARQTAGAGWLVAALGAGLLWLGVTVIFEFVLGLTCRPGRTPYNGVDAQSITSDSRTGLA